MTNSCRSPQLDDMNVRLGRESEATTFEADGERRGTEDDQGKTKPVHDSSSMRADDWRLNVPSSGWRATEAAVESWNDACFSRSRMRGRA